MDPDSNPPSEREWTIEEQETFFASQDAITGLSPSTAASNAPTLSDNEPLTLDKLVQIHDEFNNAFPIPLKYQHGADMSRATFDELGKTIRLVKPQGEAWLGVNSDRFIGVDIHIVDDVPYGVVEECRCKERSKDVKGGHTK